MATTIHPTAVVDLRAQLAEGVTVGPYAVIEENVSIGRGTTVGPHAVLTGWTRIGADNRIGVGAVIGAEPQDLAYKGAKTFVQVGDGNVFREYVTIHRGTKEGTTTVLGDRNFLMANAHVGHNCRVGSSVIFANAMALGGYVQVDDFAFISACCLVHQFCRVGKYAMMRGGKAISLDLPPYCVVGEDNQVAGINTVGLERRGFSLAQIRGIKTVYRKVFNSEKQVGEAVGELLAQDLPAEQKAFLEFIKASERGICRPEA